MEGLFQHKPFVDLLLQYLSPLEYLVLRRTVPVFVRNPAIYPPDFVLQLMVRVREGFRLGSYLYGNKLLWTLFGEYYDGDSFSKKCCPDRHPMVHFSGARYTRERGLEIRDLDLLVRRSFRVDLSDYLVGLLDMNQDIAPCNCVYHDLAPSPTKDYQLLIYYRPAHFDLKRMGNFSQLPYNIRWFKHRTHVKGCANMQPCACKSHQKLLRDDLVRWNFLLRPRVFTQWNKYMAKHLVCVGPLEDFTYRMKSLMERNDDGEIDLFRGDYGIQ